MGWEVTKTWVVVDNSLIRPPQTLPPLSIIPTQLVDTFRPVTNIQTEVKTMKGPFIVFRVIAALLLLALIVAGGFFAYRAGVAEGIAQAPQSAEAIQHSAV